MNTICSIYLSLYAPLFLLGHFGFSATPALCLEFTANTVLMWVALDYTGDSVVWKADTGTLAGKACASPLWAIWYLTICSWKVISYVTVSRRRGGKKEGKGEVKVKCLPLEGESRCQVLERNILGILKVYDKVKGNT